MSWAPKHMDSERYASLAEEARRRHDFEGAKAYYSKAAEAETFALEALSLEKRRTYAVTIVSAAALWFKAGDYAHAQQIAARGLANGSLPQYATSQLREILQTAWNEEAITQIKGQFEPGEFLVNLSGGRVVMGGAPMDLIQRKLDQISRIMYRVIEYVLQKPFRERGTPDPLVMEQFRPWLFQAPAGSYQFSVRIERPAQLELIPKLMIPDATDVTDSFMSIVRASVNDPDQQLTQLVPDDKYKSTFIRLSRNLAPALDGKLFERLTIRTPGLETDPVVVTAQAREVTGKALMVQHVSEAIQENEGTVRVLTGVLRGLELDKDWLTIRMEDGQHIRVTGAGDAIDDIVGPMVNTLVSVEVEMRNSKYFFRDIQPIEQ